MGTSEKPQARTLSPCELTQQLYHLGPGRLLVSSSSENPFVKKYWNKLLSAVLLGNEQP